MHESQQRVFGGWEVSADGLPNPRYRIGRRREVKRRFVAGVEPHHQQILTRLKLHIDQNLVDARAVVPVAATIAAGRQMSVDRRELPPIEPHGETIAPAEADRERDGLLRFHRTTQKHGRPCWASNRLHNLPVHQFPLRRPQGAPARQLGGRVDSLRRSDESLDVGRGQRRCREPRAEFDRPPGRWLIVKPFLVARPRLE